MSSLVLGFVAVSRQATSPVHEPKLIPIPLECRAPCVYRQHVWPLAGSPRRVVVTDSQHPRSAAVRGLQPTSEKSRCLGAAARPANEAWRTRADWDVGPVLPKLGGETGIQDGGPREPSSFPGPWLGPATTSRSWVSLPDHHRHGRHSALRNPTLCVSRRRRQILGEAAIGGVAVDLCHVDESSAGLGLGD